MSLRIVKDEPPKKRGRARREPLFSAEEERTLRAAIKAMRGSYGGWRHLARAMGMSEKFIESAASGRAPVSGEMAIRAARAARKPLECYRAASLMAARSRYLMPIKEPVPCVPRSMMGFRRA